MCGVLIWSVFVVISCLHLAWMDSNTSWEHHPCSGPIVVFHTAQQPFDYIFGALMFVTLSVGICLPAFRFGKGNIVVSAVSALAWVGISMWAALMASA